MIRYVMSDFEDEGVDNFINFCNINTPDIDNNLKIYLKSDGGQKWGKEVILDVLKDYNVLIYIIEANSAAFELLHEFTGNIDLGEYSYGMYHLSYMRIGYNAGLKMPELSLGDLLVKDAHNELAQINKFMNDIKLTKKEKDLILTGQDVYFNHKRLKEIFKNKLIKK